MIKRARKRLQLKKQLFYLYKPEVKLFDGGFSLSDDDVLHFVFMLQINLCAYLVLENKKGPDSSEPSQSF